MNKICRNLLRPWSRILAAGPPSVRSIHSSCITPSFRSSYSSPIKRWLLNSSSSRSTFSQFCLSEVHMPHPPAWIPVRNVSSRERKKRRKPMTPVTSKLKKIKMKSYSSYKDRFRTMKDGTVRRWRAGKNHNAHLKSKKSKRRLRQPSTVHPAYATVMKKLNFCA